jgi:quercetin dioxygenase-like cupin family protein
MRLLFVAFCATASFSVVYAADPDPLQDFCVADLSPNAPLVNGFPCKPRSTVTAQDFVYTGLRNPATYKSDTGAVAVVATPLNFPGINTQGVTHARLDFAIGGVFPLHTHPRAAETLFVLKGSVYTGFISDDNKLYASTLKQGDVILFPRGLQHFQLNVGDETAITFNTLTSQSPGFLLTANQIFEPNITSAVIEKSFGVNAATAKKLKASVPNLFRA